MSRLRHELVERAAALVAPLGEALMTPATIRRARFVPGPPRFLFGPYRKRGAAWERFTREIPAELLTVAGIRRDPAAAEEAFARGPVPVWAYLHADAAMFTLRQYWRSVGPILPLVSRALHRASQVGKRAPATGRAQADPAELTRELKELALSLGASAAGVAPYDPKYTFAEFQGQVVGDRVVILAIEQDWDATQACPSARSERASFIGYAQAFEAATKLVEFLQARGYRGQVHPLDGHSVEIHYGVQAGLGQLGLNGQLLTPQAGSRCRLLSLDTDAPLVLDVPVDYGIHKVCDACQACVERCPSGAIPNTRQMHRGVEKIKINTARCLPVVSQAEGCAVCMKVCPVQRYGLGAVLDEYERSGGILGRGTDELEGYDWPLDGRHYRPGERPTLRPEFFNPPGTDWDFKRETAPAGSATMKLS
jgi:epoxyqueuosine reductase